MPSLSRTINIKRLTRNKIISFKFKVSSFKFKPAFTLIELLVVVAIMAVLAAAIVYSTNNARQKGKDARRKQDLQAISTALVSYYADHHQYPLSLPNPDIVLDYSSDSVPVSPETSWIPGLSSYMNKIPKDPLQAVIGSKLAQAIKKPFVSLAGIFSHVSVKTVSATATCVPSATRICGSINAADDVAVRTAQGENANAIDKGSKGKANGRNITCTNDPTEYSFRFTLNQGLINNPHIDRAKVLFTPRNVTQAEKDTNSQTGQHPSGQNIRTQFRVEIGNLSPNQITDGNNWGGRTKSNTSVAWDTIGGWGPTDPITNAQIDITPAMQELIDKNAALGISTHIMVFWENKNPNHCGGRIPGTDPTDPADTPPEIIIDTSTPPAPACSPTSHSDIYAGETAIFGSNGGSGAYLWNLTGGSPTTPLNQQSVTVQYPTGGNSSVSVTRGVQTSGPCTIHVITPTLPGDTPGGETTTNTACNAKSNIFCYRISVDKKHFIIWAQMENRNDPESQHTNSDSTKEWGPSAVCKETPPTDSYLNYCLLSPK